MISQSPCATVAEIDTDHSPFLSARKELLDALLAVA
jgi:hypothetical protein